VSACLVSKGIGSMAREFNPTALIPPGVVMESVDDTGTAVVIMVRSSTVLGDCPGRGYTSHRVHSRYTRSLADLPLSGRPVQLKLLVRRFRCDRALCTRLIFSERLAAAIPWARRTARLDEIVHHLGLALGGRPAASFAQRLRLPVSNDTLLRVVRRRGSPAFAPPQAVGIDDWAWKRNRKRCFWTLELSGGLRMLPVPGHQIIDAILRPAVYQPGE
jgi:transposase